MSPILNYIQLGKLPLDDGEVRKIRKQDAKYTLLSGKLYRMEKATPMLRCLGEDDNTLVFTKVHKGACSKHISGKALAHKLLRVGYYWSTLMKDNITFVNKCDQCQRCADHHHTSTKHL